MIERPARFLPQSLDELRRAFFSAAWLVAPSSDAASWQLWNPADSGYDCWLFALHSKAGTFSGANRLLGYQAASVLVANVQPSLCYADVGASAAAVEFRAEVLNTIPGWAGGAPDFYDALSVTNEWPDNNLLPNPIRIPEGTGLAFVTQVTGPDWWLGASFLELPV